MAAQGRFRPVTSIRSGHSRLGRGCQRDEWQILEVVLPYAPLPIDWPVVIEAAAQMAGRE